MTAATATPARSGGEVAPDVLRRAKAGGPGYLVTTGVPAGGPDRRIARPEPLGPMADFVVALARAGDPRITAPTVAGRPAWHYDGPTAVDRLGGDGAPNHAVADVDQETGVLLHLTRRLGDLVVNRFTASDVAVGGDVDQAVFRIEPPAGAQTTTVPLGFDGTDRTLTLEEAAAAVPYDLLVPDQVPDGFRQHSILVNRDVPSPTGPEAMNPPATSVAVGHHRRHRGHDLRRHVPGRAGAGGRQPAGPPGRLKRGRRGSRTATCGESDGFRLGVATCWPSCRFRGSVLGASRSRPVGG